MAHLEQKKKNDHTLKSLQWAHFVLDLAQIIAQ